MSTFHTDNSKGQMRQISIEGCELIGEGNTSKVYRLNSRQILKLYKSGTPKERIEREQQNTHTACRLGVPTANAFDIVTCDGQYGLILELVRAVPIGKLVIDDPDGLKRYGDMMAGVMHTLHDAKAPEGTLIAAKDIYEQAARKMSKYLTAGEVDAIMGMIESIPDKNSLIHGDPNLDNIMMRDDSPVIIDMADLTVGNPVYDLGSYYLYGLMKKNEYPTALWDEFIRSYYHTDDDDVIQRRERAIRLVALLRSAVTPALWNITDPVELETYMGVTREHLLPYAKEFPDILEESGC